MEMNVGKNSREYCVRPYTEIGGPYNEARINKKHVEAQKRRARRAKAKEQNKNVDEGQEM